MPSVNVYVKEEIYAFLTNRSGGKATALAKIWLEERYAKEKEQGEVNE